MGPAVVTSRIVVGRRCATTMMEETACVQRWSDPWCACFASVSLFIHLILESILVLVSLSLTQSTVRSEKLGENSIQSMPKSWVNTVRHLIYADASAWRQVFFFLLPSFSFLLLFFLHFFLHIFSVSAFLSVFFSSSLPSLSFRLHYYNSFFLPFSQFFNLFFYLHFLKIKITFYLFFFASLYTAQHTNHGRRRRIRSAPRMSSRAGVDSSFGGVGSVTQGTSKTWPLFFFCQSPAHRIHCIYINEKCAFSFRVRPSSSASSSSVLFSSLLQRRNTHTKK